MIYLDSASTTPISKEVLDEMIPYMTTKYGNPNSIHTAGIEARRAIDKAREQVASSINADPRSIIFTSGGSEGNNMVIHGIRKAFPSICFVSSRMEHTSSVKALDDENVNSKCVSYIEDFKNEYAYDADWATLMWRMFVNNEVGKITDVYEIGKTCYKNENLLFGTDCVQAFGFEKIDVREMKCDFLTISSHKIHGPKGVGALYVKDRSLIKPIINGGTNQEFGLRGGTENVAGIVGFGKACEIAEKNREENKSRILYLRNLFIECLDETDYSINCKDCSKILSVQVKGVDAETMVLALSSSGILVSSGAACKNLESKVNESLTSFGLTEQEARSTIRISFMESNTKNDVLDAAGKLKQLSNALKGGKY